MKVRPGVYLDRYVGAYRYFYIGDALHYEWLSGGYKGRSGKVLNVKTILKINLIPIDTPLERIIYDVEDIWPLE